MIQLPPNSDKVLRDIRDGRQDVDADVKRACEDALDIIHEVNKRAIWKDRSAARNAFEPWHPEDEQRMIRDHTAGLDVHAIAESLGRSANAVRLRLVATGYEPRDSVA